jgi:hypothetical protein
VFLAVLAQRRLETHSSFQREPEDTAVHMTEASAGIALEAAGLRE